MSNKCSKDLDSVRLESTRSIEGERDLLEHRETSTHDSKYTYYYSTY